ncbi:MAG: GNAT family N-acetyltransferase [Exiguobacterium sp.]|nr:GNAT family N-acetyltransferase [Exiguobacterium sp.]MBR2757931.1 GNAT family N-acetyltransferase [Exiguobacterium sp.]MBR3063904.1 GNAT family N-acetyltransferase [Exiguobacterium sp.]MBR3217408.1 GNAT family N-acetyltransferase [Exiguobacterium sp.]
MLIIQSGNEATLIEQAKQVREIVFVQEQRIDTSLEYDDLDGVCTHVVGLLDSEPVTTARLRKVDSTVGKVERVATIQAARGHGYGKEIMDEVERVAKRQGLVELRLGAQLTALPFYEKLGYEAFGDEFLDADIPHRMMRKIW